ncbi:hypothetical protein QTP70_007534 [Hemibagrus guttatus]|uniref:F-box domain-containing protein n=1 Tax=Hemibagrus guttatus TaxID=175788 RepID=A0AAE0UXJ9_9TELE|nr:hypothetical protein QTP70_007534 [Hemibagrus guttatus]
MKLRVKVNKQTNRVDLEEPEPTLTQLSILVKEAVLPSAGLSTDAEFSLSLNGKDPLVDTGQTLASCGVVSGDMISVILPHSDPSPSSPSPSSHQTHSFSAVQQKTQQSPTGLSTCQSDASSSYKSRESACDPETKETDMERGEAEEEAVGLFIPEPMLCCEAEEATLKMTGAVEFSRKLVLKPDAYVTKEWAGGNAGVVYRNLQKLSRVFKDQLAYPLIATAREALGLPALFGLAVLPPELLLRIMRLLDVPSILKLSEVCRRLHSATQDASLWKHFVNRDFRVNFQAVTEHRDTDWKELYKKKFQQKKTRSKYRARFYPFQGPPIYPNPPVPFPPLPLPLFPPGIIGGEHDQRPAIPQGILPRPRYDPIGPFEPRIGLPFGRRLLRPGGSRTPDTRRGFI